MYKMTVYKKDKGCPNCAVLDRLMPTFQKKYPDISWDFVVVSADGPPTELPEYVKAFPTSVLDLGDGSPVTVITGYETMGRKLHDITNS